jgi:hypothetical protein
MEKHFEEGYKRRTKITPHEEEDEDFDWKDAVHKAKIQIKEDEEFFKKDEEEPFDDNPEEAENE